MPYRRQQSAGLLVFRRRKTIEVLLAHSGGPYWRNKDAGAWTILKGEIESSSALACAKREFKEETGLTAEGSFVELTPVRQKGGKTVYAFALESDFDLSAFASNEFDMEWPPRSGKRARFPEVDRIAYFNLAAARKKILPSQRPLIEELARKLREQ